MSLSKEERFQNIDQAVRLMMEELGGYGIRRLLADPRDARYQNVRATTWTDLEELYLVKPRHSAAAVWYTLTGPGWLKGLELTRTMERAKIDAGKLMSELKKRVDGRDRTAFVHSGEIATAAGISEDFLENIVESRFIERVLKRHSAEAKPMSTGYTFKIPINFGQEIL